MNTAAEKRQNRRVGCAVPIESKKGSRFDDSHTVDISKGGVGLVSSRPLPIDTTMAIEIDLTAAGNPILAMGQVKWVQQLPGDGYRIGFSFTDLAAASKNRLERHFRA